MSDCSRTTCVLRPVSTCLPTRFETGDPEVGEKHRRKSLTHALGPWAVTVPQQRSPGRRAAPNCGRSVVERPVPRSGSVIVVRYTRDRSALVVRMITISEFAVRCKTASLRAMRPRIKLQRRFIQRPPD